jgi:Protein of unknown function (DUF3617)
MGKRTSAWILALPLLAAAQPLNIKPGAWEITTKSAALPKPVVEKECITKADIAELVAEADADDEDDCKFVKPPLVSGNKWSADKQCKNGRKVHAEFSTESPERVQGTIVSTDAKASMLTVDVSAKWLGASCAGIR